MTALLAALGACQTDVTFAIERRIPAALPLPEVRRVGVVAFVGSGGELLAEALEKKLTEDHLFEPLAAAIGSDAAWFQGEITTLEVSPTLETATLVTKRTKTGEPKDVPTSRKLKTGKLQATWRVALADGRVRPGRAVTVDLRCERIEDPDPTLATLEPKDLPTQQDAIPSDEQMISRLVESAAASIAREALPRREPAVVTWEDAGGVDRDARRAFAERDYVKAEEELRVLLNERALSVHERACVLYDAALAEDALGDYPRAERHLDEALSLENSERHQSALRDLRHRAELARQEERR